jgi:hypothetical protein
MGFAARYDFSTATASFDFFTWLVHVQRLGADEIVFDTRRFRTTKWDAAEARRRYETIIKPGMALAGMSWREGTDGRAVGTHHLGDLARLGGFRRLRSVKPPLAVRYTVTLRRNAHNPHRNSKESIWREFAAEIDALVIDDYAVRPIDLLDRVALYAGAEMNFGVTNGPLALLFLTDYPYMMFDCISNPKGFAGHGIALRGQVPWAGPDQLLVWEKQKLKFLRRAFATWRADKDARNARAAAANVGAGLKPAPTASRAA